MAKLIGEKAVFNRLNKYVEKNFTQEEIDTMEFHVDQEGDLTWAWVFDLNGKRYTVEIDRFTGKIRQEIN